MFVKVAPSVSDARPEGVLLDVLSGRSSVRPFAIWRQDAAARSAHGLSRDERLAATGSALDRKWVRMAVGIRIKLAGITQEQFDHVHDQVNPDRTPPNGLLFHASGPIDGGWGIIDFWESRADFDAFAPRIVEGMAAAGIEPQGQPDIKEFPVHEMIGA